MVAWVAVWPFFLLFYFSFSWSIMTILIEINTGPPIPLMWHLFILFIFRILAWERNYCHNIDNWTQATHMAINPEDIICCLKTSLIIFSHSVGGNHEQTVLYLIIIWAVTRDFQQYGILTIVDSDEPVQPPFRLRNSNWCSVSSLIFID